MISAFIFWLSVDRGFIYIPLPAGLSPGVSNGLSYGIFSGLSPGVYSGLSTGISPGLSLGHSPGLSPGPFLGLSPGPSSDLSTGLSLLVSVLVSLVHREMYISHLHKFTISFLSTICKWLYLNALVGADGVRFTSDKKDNIGDTFFVFCEICEWMYFPALILWLQPTPLFCDLAS